jgi:hypothetical protein
MIRYLAAAILLATGTPGFAHRLDEYLQATILSVEKHRVTAELRLTPGVAVFPAVLASIDADGDGAISGAEQVAYAERVVHDLSLTQDGQPLHLRLRSVKFANPEELKEGLGEIQLEIDADLPAGGGSRRLVFQNHHQSGIAAYLVNTLAPRDPDIRFTAQERSWDQSVYRLGYEQAGSVSRRWWAGAATLLLLARVAWARRARRGIQAGC